MLSVGGSTPDRYINRHPVDLVFYDHSYWEPQQSGTYSATSFDGASQGEIDFMPASGPSRGAVIKGLFTLDEKGYLRICLPNDPATERPKSFGRTSAEQPLVFTYVRVNDLQMGR